MNSNHEDEFVKDNKYQIFCLKKNRILKRKNLHLMSLKLKLMKQFQQLEISSIKFAHLKQNQNRPASKSKRPESSKYSAQNRKGGSQTQLNVQKDQQQEQNVHHPENERQNDYQNQRDNKNEENDQAQQQKNKQIYQALKKQSSQPIPHPIIQKMSKFIAFHHISLETFWKSSSIYVGLDEFVDYCIDIGLIIQEWELDKVQDELIDEDGFVTIKIICDKIQPWHNQENAMLEFIRQKALGMAQTSKKKFRVQSQKNARQSSAKSGHQRPMTGNSQETQESQYKILENKSKTYLKMHREKSKDKDKLLNITINKNQNEHEYECLIKMGEANEIQEQLKSKKNYRAYKNPDGHMMVHAYDGERFLTEMTLIEFKREHTSLKLAYNESKNLKIWDLLSENKKAIKGRDFSKNIQKEEPVVVEKVDGEATGKKVKVTRQQQLKKVLLETMWLSNIINEQSNILNKKGINVSNNLNKSYNTINVNKSMNASHQM